MGRRGYTPHLLWLRSSLPQVLDCSFMPKHRTFMAEPVNFFIGWDQFHTKNFRAEPIKKHPVDVRSIFLGKGLSGEEAFDEIFCQWQGPGLVVVGNEGLVLCFLRHLVAFNHHRRHCCKAKIRDLNSVLDSMQCITMSYWALIPGS